ADGPCPRLFRRRGRGYRPGDARALRHVSGRRRQPTEAFREEGVMAEALTVEPLTKAAFAPFGTVIEADPATMRLINDGTTERYHGLATAEAEGEGARVMINIFRGSPRAFPYVVGMMERHPFGSQSFSPIDDRSWLVIA